MRISQNMIYSNSLRYMNTSLLQLTKANEQNSTQLRINRPSDDPSGYSQARQLDSVIAGLDQYASNIDTAKAWLNQADSTLVSASTLMTSIKGLATQAATGTLSDANRMQIASEVRAYFEQMVTLANTQVSGNSIFGGQKTRGPAFVQTLHASVNDSTLTQDAVESVAGDSATSVMVQFTSAGEVGGTSDIGYRYSSDGGSTWTAATLAAGERTLNLGGASVTLKAGSEVTETGGGSGTSLVVRPSALYLGDDNDGAAIRAYGATASQVNATASGVFAGNVSVRIDAAATLPGSVSYSYSLDGGANWVEGNTGSGGRLQVPGGYLELTAGGGNTLSAGDMFTVVPNTADISVDIGPNGSVVMNNVGKDVFGGLYKEAGASNATPVFGADSGTNLFEVVGDLIGCLETNDMDGVGDALEKLTTAQAHLESCAASVGARENKLDFADNTVAVLRDNAVSQLSSVEDADLSQLLLELAKYQYAYQSVLSSSSRIMGMSLLNYI